NMNPVNAPDRQPGELPAGWRLDEQDVPPPLEYAHQVVVTLGQAAPANLRQPDQSAMHHKSGIQTGGGRPSRMVLISSRWSPLRESASMPAIASFSATHLK